ncbi:hypothetical protein POSPLADRAFT_1050759 [Postia placenta MAD-698-R-SB12]|uniref:Uncharacterized protein n=1 Tax=Postia placenta MAD-698-R-SB12 TaxID=670580 RepID=A0A1X6MIN4_9APHY|nr:hypothetical protein POSPLADRAFT_1050759 [Postia placenta MAD-698-R-SB12]OSX56230.1 hypothetical protein POSPLADRAFT_1050759 [Postia placenta MAD-698-R-SB12]
MLHEVQDTGYRNSQTDVADDEGSTAAALAKRAQAGVVSNVELIKPMLRECGASFETNLGEAKRTSSRSEKSSYEHRRRVTGCRVVS